MCAPDLPSVTDDIIGETIFQSLLQKRPSRFRQFRDIVSASTRERSNEPSGRYSTRSSSRWKPIAIQVFEELSQEIVSETILPEFLLHQAPPLPLMQMNDTDEIAAKGFNIELTQRHLSSLRPNAWINDNVSTHSACPCSNPPFPSCANIVLFDSIGPTFFFEDPGGTKLKQQQCIKMLFLGLRILHEAFEGQLGL